MITYDTYYTYRPTTQQVTQEQKAYFDWLDAEIEDALREAEERGLSDYDLDNTPHWQELKALLDQFDRETASPEELAARETDPFYIAARQVDTIKAEYQAKGWGDYTSDPDYLALSEKIVALAEAK